MMLGFGKQNRDKKNVKREKLKVHSEYEVKEVEDQWFQGV